jgi:hypothetical protein
MMCPARLILLDGGSGADLAGERIAQVYASAAAAEQAGRLAEDLGVRLTVVPELTTDEPVRRADAALGEIADLHRGETVVVVAPGLDLGIGHARGKVVIEHTGDGWSVVPGDNEVTLATYEQAAERFRESIPREPNATLIGLFDQLLDPGSIVLEIGSGTGRDAVELERRGYRVRRTDAAGSFVEMIRADGFEADRLNALTDDFGGPYDLVFADAVFLHFDRAQLRTVLRKANEAAGLLAFSTREGDGAEWSTRYLDLPRHITMWREEPLRALLTETGWSVDHLQRSQSKVGSWFHILARRT